MRYDKRTISPQLVALRLGCGMQAHQTSHTFLPPSHISHSHVIICPQVVALLLGCAMVVKGGITAEQLTNFIFYVGHVSLCFASARLE